MSVSHCREETAAAVAAALSSGTDVPAETLDHVASCAGCREALRAGAALAAPLEAGDETATPAAPGQSPGAWALRAKLAASDVVVHRRETLRRLRLAVALILFILSVGIVLGGTSSLVPPGQAGPVRWAAVLLLPLLAYAASRLVRGARLFKRLGRGRVLSGVCLGLAEMTGVTVLAWRLAFVGAFVLTRGALVAYLLLDLLMEAHPEDRSLLWRYRFSKWLRRVLRSRVGSHA